MTPWSTVHLNRTLRKVPATELLLPLYRCHTHRHFDNKRRLRFDEVVPIKSFPTACTRGVTSEYADELACESLKLLGGARVLEQAQPGILLRNSLDQANLEKTSCLNFLQERSSHGRRMTRVGSHTAKHKAAGNNEVD